VMPLPPPWSVPYLCVLLLMISAVGVVRIADWGSAVLGRRATLVAPAIALAVTTTNVWLDCRYHDRVAAPWFIGNVDARATATWLAANRPAIDPAIAAGDESILYYLYLAGTSDLDVFFDRDRAESTGTVWLIERDVPPIARERSARIRAEIEQQNFRVTDTVHTMRRSRILAMRKQR